MRRKRVRIFSVLAGAILLAAPAIAQSDFSKNETINPYLQDVTRNTIKVMWITKEPSRSVVYYGRSSDYGMKSIGSGEALVHEVPLSGLEEDATYHYKVASGGMASNDSTFKTAPSQKSGFSFLVYGDNRTDKGGGAYATIHEKLMSSAEKINPKTIFFNIGDLCYSGANEEWQPQFFLPAKSILKDTVFYPAIGNHEYKRKDLYEKYFSPPAGNSGTKLYYSFNYGNTHFIVLDTSQPYAKSSRQYDWLVSDLDSQSASGAKWIIALFHHPVFSSYRKPSPEMRDDIAPLFKSKGVALAISGHDHFYERYFKDGVCYLITAGGGAPLRNPGTADIEGRKFYKKVYHYCLLEAGTSDIKVTAYDKNGNVFDSFTIT